LQNIKKGRGKKLEYIPEKTGEINSGSFPTFDEVEEGSSFTVKKN
jgi:hypothetical protein